MSGFHIKLPATSANLGPGFDAVALALELYLEVRAEIAPAYSAEATGRNIEICTRLKRNLMVASYEETLRSEGLAPIPLALTISNGIPIGMGCGSSAAARLAGISLANHFGKLGWNDARILKEACRMEGHPDNAAACWFGGFTVAGGIGDTIQFSSVAPPKAWSAILVIPDQPLSTSTARAILPQTYTRADAVTNIQNVALLTAAFHSGKDELLRLGMTDRLHHPYRQEVCPLLPILQQLATLDCILGITLSGAGPAVLVLIKQADLLGALRRIKVALSTHLIANAEILPVLLAGVTRQA